MAPLGRVVALIGCAALLSPFTRGSSARQRRESGDGLGRFGAVVAALGGEDAIVKIQGFRASLLFSNWVVQRLTRPRDVGSTERKFKEQRETALKRPAN